MVLSRLGTLVRMGRKRHVEGSVRVSIPTRDVPYHVAAEKGE